MLALPALSALNVRAAFVSALFTTNFDLPSADLFSLIKVTVCCSRVDKEMFVLFDCGLWVGCRTGSRVGDRVGKFNFGIDEIHLDKSSGQEKPDVGLTVCWGNGVAVGAVVGVSDGFY